MPGAYPMYTVDGTWNHSGENWTNWCEGFLPGMMWIFFARTGDSRWRQLAEQYTRPLAERQHDRNVHDLNFVLGSSFGRWFALEPERWIHDILITAGQTMGLRFREKGQYLRSFVSEDSLFIDIMMNVGIVFRAALDTDDADLLRRANAHCATTRRYLVRGDGSTAHEGLFDLDTGEFLRQTTHQGYRGDSNWVRGLAWSLYGFGTSYSYTGEADYLQAAESNADSLIRNLPASGVTPYDFDAPAECNPIDTSGSAIGATGLLQLATLTDSAEQAARYRAAALRMIEPLLEAPYLGGSTPGFEGILSKQIYHLHKGLGVGGSCMFGEYFFVEALDKLLSAAGST
ncbi:MAG: glycoside hydrolase family 88 protein [Armatimonadetes bacterium]|nr:glycoside hydrolase family 88 protein [Armatimonadota bacterium]